jgi:hypothetical protein
MNEQKSSVKIVESLRRGLPPQRGVDRYSVGNEKLTNGIKRFHLSGISERGIIRFISGSWGAGKTHFFRLLREVAFQNNCLVSNVELSVNEAPLNKFERVFYGIVRNIMTPTYYTEDEIYTAAPFGRVVQESLLYLSRGTSVFTDQISYEDYNKAGEALMLEPSIDIDFKKMIQKYWETYLPEAAEPTIQEQTRAEILQWFSGEGTLGSHRKRFGVNKIVGKDNAKLMLQSLAGFVRLSGYNGLLILFDEAEKSYSVMRKSALKDAHNNLLSLINNVETLPGLFLIYATTPDFFTDPKHGIVIYGALAGRIGRPENRQPRALDTIWNFDEVDTELPGYQTAASKIRTIYVTAYPEAEAELPSEDEVDDFVKELHQIHPSLSAVRFWRVMISALITHFDDYLEGEIRPTEQLYDDVMDRLRED